MNGQKPWAESRLASGNRSDIGRCDVLPSSEAASSTDREPSSDFKPDHPLNPRGLMRVSSFFSSLKTERTACKNYRTRDDAKADVFDYIERFYNTIRRHSTIGYVSPVEFERRD